MSIIEQARAWIAQDPDPETRAELEVMIASGERERLQARFTQGLHFGTAGIRGVLGAGPSRMNRVNAIRAAHGLCAWLKQCVPEATNRGLCVGRDARRKSDVFERDIVEVALGAGVMVRMFSREVPTPVLAFSVVQSGAAAGMMVTASHNPPDYNGCKVFWENGAQIIPPNDEGIARQIAAAPNADRVARLSVDEGRRRGLVRDLDPLIDAYVGRVLQLVAARGERRKVRVAYTALHGVAEPIVRAVMSRTDFCELHSVAAQAKPDPGFPTVAFPNPEEPGAMDRVLALGEEIDADLVLANDPDGDRLAVSVRHGDELEALSGDEVGLLLANDLLDRYDGRRPPLVVSTVVSSPMLGAIAASHGARWERTATGHKWIQNRALDLESEGYQMVFGYEEALGYAPIPDIRDKDGISAALAVADLASRLNARGQTLIDARNELWETHGVWIDHQRSIRFEGEDATERMASEVAALRSRPPSELGGQAVLSVRDLKGADLLMFELEGGHRAMIRPSGTEPKLKHYFHATHPGSSNLDEARGQTRALLARMEADLVPSLERSPKDGDHR